MHPALALTPALAPAELTAAKPSSWSCATPPPSNSCPFLQAPCIQIFLLSSTTSQVAFFPDLSLTLPGIRPCTYLRDHTHKIMPAASHHPAAFQSSHTSVSGPQSALAHCAMSHAPRICTRWKGHRSGMCRSNPPSCIAIYLPSMEPQYPWSTQAGMGWRAGVSVCKLFEA